MIECPGLSIFCKSFCIYKEFQSTSRRIHMIRLYLTSSNTGIPIMTRSLTIENSPIASLFVEFCPVRISQTEGVTAAAATQSSITIGRIPLPP